MDMAHRVTYVSQELEMLYMCTIEIGSEEKALRKTYQYGDRYIQSSRAVGGIAMLQLLISRE